MASASLLILQSSFSNQMQIKAVVYYVFKTRKEALIPLRLAVFLIELTVEIRAHHHATWF